jgi:sugar O-acyltransferase (sialic acid O-acetyltransferase NeuD family)
MTRKILLVGTGSFAEVAFEYFEGEAETTVAGFLVESAYRDRTEFCDVPVIDFENAEASFPPDEHEIFVALVYNELNRSRTRLLSQAKGKGYRAASFISKHAFISKSATLGEHCFVFEGNVIQPQVSIGDNVVLWSGNHIGHHTRIENNVFVSSHVVISGHCTIGENCFLGVNSAITNDTVVGADCWIGPGVTIPSDVPAGSMYSAPKPTPSKVSTHRFFKLEP